MDEFGVLTASYGLKPQGKSAPMAASRRSNNHLNYNNNTTTDTSKRDRHHYSSNSGYGGGAFSHDDFGTFRSANHNNTKSQSFGNYGDAFGGFEKNSTMQSNAAAGAGAGAGSFNYDSMHKNLNDFGLRSSSLPSYNNNGSSNKNVYGFEDDIFGGMPGLNVSSSVINHDVFAPFASASNQINGSIDDLLGNIGGSKVKANVVIGNKLNGFDDLIPGFAGRSPLIDGKKLGTKSTSTLLEDPFAMLSTPENASLGVLSDALEKLGQLSTSGRTHVAMHANVDPFDVFVNIPSRPDNSESSKTTDDAQTSIPKIPPFKHPANGAVPVRPPIKPPHVSKGDRVKSPVVSPIDELEKFATGKVRNTSSPSATPLKDATERFEEKIKLAKERRNTNVSRDKGSPETLKYNSKTSDDGLDPIFTAISRSKSAPRSRTSQNESMVNEPLHSGGGTKVGQLKKTPSAMNIVDDLSSIFEDGMPGGNFEEVQGESEERRRARLGRQCRINDRVAAAVADMNQRDLQSQREQEERHRISETLDGEIKRWAAGKEGNMRALLSSLQLILWAESGWQAVSLTDIITSTSVKQVYRKATLCLHPDKVQQRGANLEQKYVAEKVFDILKEAWNKFSKEELS